MTKARALRGAARRMFERIATHSCQRRGVICKTFDIGFIMVADPGRRGDWIHESCSTAWDKALCGAPSHGGHHCESLRHKVRGIEKREVHLDLCLCRQLRAGDVLAELLYGEPFPTRRGSPTIEQRDSPSTWRSISPSAWSHPHN